MVNTLTSFIRQQRDQILRDWLARAAKLPRPERQAPLNLRDHVPAILDRLADAIDRRDYGPRPLEDLPEQHALVRYHEGYDLRQVVAEYRLLRRVIVDLYAELDDLSLDSESKMTSLTVMHEAIDRAISEAVDQYAVERDRVRDRFIAVLGHDLRDPLNTILFTANAQLAKPDDGQGGEARGAARIRAAAERMDRMIRDVLDFARGRLGGGFTIVPAALDAQALVGHAVHEFAHAHPDRDVQWPTRRAAGDFQVDWDADRIAQLLTNIIGNAFVHGQDPVTIQMTDAGDEIEIQVSNRGEIPSDVLPHLFDPFVSDAPNKAHHGLGLGLYIVKQIAQAHGGTVRGDSSNDLTTMTVTLPRRAPSNVA